MPAGEDLKKVEHRLKSEENTANVEVAKTNQETHVITNNPIAENYNTTYQNIKIKNQTDYQLTEEM